MWLSTNSLGIFHTAEQFCNIKFTRIRGVTVVRHYSEMNCKFGHFKSGSPSKTLHAFGLIKLWTIFLIFQLKQHKFKDVVFCEKFSPLLSLKARF